MDNCCVKKVVNFSRSRRLHTVLAIFGAGVIFLGAIISIAELPLPDVRYINQFTEESYVNYYKKTWTFYMFNFTNSMEVYQNSSPPKFTKVGPFELIERRELVNITWQSDRVSFQKRIFFHETDALHHIDEETENVDYLNPLLPLRIRSVRQWVLEGFTRLGGLAKVLKQSDELPLLAKNGSVDDGIWTYSTVNGSFLQWESSNGASKVHSEPKMECTYVPKGCTLVCSDYRSQFTSRVSKSLFSRECVFCQPPYIFEVSCDNSTDCGVHSASIYEYSYIIKVKPHNLSAVTFPLIEVTEKSELMDDRLEELDSFYTKQLILGFSIELFIFGLVLLLFASFSFAIRYFESKRRCHQALTLNGNE